MKTNARYRNIAIIAHVDHGKTTLVDKLLREGGAYRTHEVAEECAMDSMDLEREKGITIKAKNASVHWGDYTVNIVDTPGHADFGGEVERIMKMVDGVLLLVDAYDGPQAQTRFVLKKALAQGLRPICVINKIDRPNANPKKVHDQVLELLLELHATEEQFNAPFIYGSGRDGYAIHELEDPRDKGMGPLFETIISHIPPPTGDVEAPFQMVITNLDWSDYVGRIAIGKVSAGKIKIGDPVWCIHKDGKRERSVCTKVFEFTGMKSNESINGEAGNIIGLAGVEELEIGETIVGTVDAEAIPFVDIDPPTIQMEFCVNDGPLNGRDGKYLTSRHLRERLFKETRTNVSVKVEDTELPNIFHVSARGELQIAVIVETMRREGYEMLVSRPHVILKRENDKTLEPFESLWVDVPADKLGDAMQLLSARKGLITNMTHHGEGTTARVQLEATIATRGLIGFETALVNITSGRAVMSHMFKEYASHCGPIVSRSSGTLVSMANGPCMAYSLGMLQERGRLMVAPGDEVYEGMIVGENPRKEDIPVNPTTEKKLSNMRSQGDGKATQLEPPMKMSLEHAIEYIANDEYVEATPHFLRLRKKFLNANDRKRNSRREEAFES